MNELRSQPIVAGPKARPFAHRYCVVNRLPPEDYARHILKRALYPHARPVAGLLEFFNRDYFSPDRDFVQDVGRLTEYHAFVGSGMDFSHHPSNRGFLRRVLRLRVSTERMRRLARAILKSRRPVAESEPAGP